MFRPQLPLLAFALLACNPPEKGVDEVLMDKRFARLGSARLKGEVTEESPVGEILMFGPSREGSDQRSLVLSDGTGSVNISYDTLDADGPVAVGERVGADIQLIVPVQLGTPSMDQESVAVATKVWHLSDEE